MIKKGDDDVNKVLNLAVVVFVMFMVGCAGLQTRVNSNYIDEHVYIADEEIAHEECTRLDAAVKSSTVLFKAIPDIQKEVNEDCGRGDLGACISVPFRNPFYGFGSCDLCTNGVPDRSHVRGCSNGVLWTRPPCAHG